MKKNTRFVGLDVHADTIAVAVAEPDGEVRSLGTIPNRTESVRKLLKKLEPTKQLKMCYEAGPTGLEILVVGAPNLGEDPREDVEGRRDWWAD